MDDRAVPLETTSRKRRGFFRPRPAVYIIILLSAVVASSLYQLRVDNIFACAASGYTSDRYLSNCGAANYGDYEHGAFWFDLEPAAEKSAVSADVLFLGDSRMLLAFSNAATAKWFSSISASFYLLGFYGFENSIFEQALLRKLRPRAEVYIIAIGDFFQPTEAPIAKTIMRGAGRSSYEVKRYLQLAHEVICMKLTKICGSDLAVFRSRQTGMWYMQTGKFKGREREVSYDGQADKREIDDAVAIGQTFLSELPVNAECVLFTVVPGVGTKLDAARAIASGLGRALVIPDHIDGLQTFDGTHLDYASGERWSDAFFKVAGPEIKKCLEAKHRDANIVLPSRSN
jgi:hypothetical protein